MTKWIIEKLDEVEEDQNEVDAAWRKEIRKRISEIKAGKIKMIPAEEIWYNIQHNGEGDNN